MNGQTPVVHDYTHNHAILETSPQVYNTALTDSSDVDSALTQIGTAIAAIDTNLTWNNVISDFDVTDTPGQITIDFTDAVWPSSATLYLEYLHGNWSTAPNGEAAVISGSGTTVSDIVDEIEIEMNSKLASGFTLTRNGLVLTLSSPSILTFSINLSLGGTATFVFDTDWTTPPVITQVLPTPGQTYEEGDNEVNVGNDAFNGRSITIDLGTNQDIEPLLSVTRHAGSNTDPMLIATHGLSTGGGNNTLSTYTVTDYNNSVITSFPSSVASASDSDISNVISSAISAINSNTENPIDFTAALVSGNIVITAEREAAVTGVWTISANHHGVAADSIGNIAFGDASVVEGVTPMDSTLINQNVPTSGHITTDDFRGAYDPDNPINS